MAGDIANVRIIFSGNSSQLNKTIAKTQASVKGLEGAFSSLSAVMMAVFSARAIANSIGTAFNVIDDYRRKTLSIAVVLTDTVKGSSNEISKAFEQNKRHASSMFKLFTVQATKSLSTVNDLLDAYQVFTSRGLSLKADSKSVQTLADVVDRINIATEGQQNQVMQELRAMLEGRARPSDVTSRIFTARDINFQKNMKLLAASGNGQAVIDYINTLISDVPLADDISKLLSKQKQNVKTAVSLWAMDAFAPLYDTISMYLSQLAESINSGDNPLVKGVENLVNDITKLTRNLVSFGAGFANSNIGRTILELSPALLTATMAAKSLSLVFQGLALVMKSAISGLYSWQGLTVLLGSAYIGMDQYISTTAKKMQEGTAQNYEIETAKFYNETLQVLDGIFAILKVGFSEIILLINKSIVSVVELIYEKVTGNAISESGNLKAQRKIVDDYLIYAGAKKRSYNPFRRSLTESQISYGNQHRALLALMDEAQNANTEDFYRNFATARKAGVPEEVLNAVNILRDSSAKQETADSSSRFWDMAMGEWSAATAKRDNAFIVRTGADSTLSDAITGPLAEARATEANGAILAQNINKLITQTEKNARTLADMDNIAADYSASIAELSSTSDDYLADYRKTKSDIAKKLAKYGVSLDGETAQMTQLERATAIQQDLVERFNAVQGNLTSEDEEVRNQAVALAEKLQAHTEMLSQLQEAEMASWRERLVEVAQIKLANEKRQAELGRSEFERQQFERRMSEGAIGSGYGIGFEYGMMSYAGSVSMQDSGAMAYDMGKNIVQEWTEAGKTAISDSLYNAILDEGGFKDILASLGESLLRSITDTIANTAMNYIVTAITDLIFGKTLEVTASEACATSLTVLTTSASAASTSLFALSASADAAAVTQAASGATSFLGGMFALAANGAVWKGGFHAFADGGMVSSPTLGLVGEGRYNEAIVPLPDGRSIPVEMTGSGNGDMTVNIYNNSTANVSAEESEDDYGRRILEIVIDGAARNKQGFRGNLRSVLGVNK